MKIARYRDATGVWVGVVGADSVTPVAPGAGAAGMAAVLSLAAAANADPMLAPPARAPGVALADVALLAPVPTPPSVRDFYAFAAHARTARRVRGQDLDPAFFARPVFYFSNPAAVIGPDAVVCAPPECAELDYELEVAWVLAKGGRDLDVADVTGLVAGFTIFNDWSARDLQRREMVFSLGPAKGKDFATSLGPWLVTTAEFAPAGLREVPAAAMSVRVNGVERTRARLEDLSFSVAEMTSYASTAAVLQAGDVLATGTCAGGCLLELRATRGEAHYPWLVPGDRVDCAVSGLGELAAHIGPRSPGPGFRLDPDRRRPAAA